MQNPNGGVDQQTYRDVLNISWIHDVIFQRALKLLPASPANWVGFLVFPTVNIMIWDGQTAPLRFQNFPAGPCLMTPSLGYSAIGIP